ncbi:hypothetical protein QJS10_CPA08g01897 [Acorus calamus]|uniref:Proteasome activator subunit 4 n=1 Tax=Acorus calamus TaxID=4465 RepID=A0AAV9EB68_ACOCL|nr:hypothetical protein QJS10_CPA08g01897 [Acorus calamus]
MMLLKKHGKKMSFKIQWRPFYDTLMTTHFTRNTGPEGRRLKQQHFETVTWLVRCCRKFFPVGAASEIWSEFRSMMDNPWHNSSFDGVGFLRLFLPTNRDNRDFFTHDWIKQCLDIWESVPKCRFWDVQWACIIGCCIKNCNSFDWECFLPELFTRYLNMFEVPVSSGSGSYPFSVNVPRNTRFLFSSSAAVPARSIAKSIVYLLKPGSSAQTYFEKFADLLEQYYHPSNGGSWTSSLERFLRHLVNAFQKRINRQELGYVSNQVDEIYMGRSERASFVKVVLKFVDRGQYSKNESLAESVATATSILSYVEPSLVLPFIASRFSLALETTTATHQLKTAVTSVAFSSRAFLLASMSSTPTEDLGSVESFIDLLTLSLSNALLGMDANDPPKTLATMQLIGSIISNLASLDDSEGGPTFLQTINFSEWLEEFFCRLFSLLRHLESSSVLDEATHTSTMSGTFLVEDGPQYFCMLEILFGKLSKPLYKQSLKKVSKFVNTNILPGAISEVGLLCCACVSSNPEEAAVLLIEPILRSITSALKESPVSGFGGSGVSNTFSRKVSLSPALETALEYHLKILSAAVSYAGPALLHYKDQLKEAIASSFEAPSWKVNGVGDYVLRSVLASLVLYYPIDQYRYFSHTPGAGELEEWISSKANHNELSALPKWHMPSKDELLFANELLELHLLSALDELLRICQNKIHSEAGNEKEHLKVTLLRIDSSLHGVMSCLPDFHPSYRNGKAGDLDKKYVIAGSSGSTVGSSELREKAADCMHVACKYLLEERSDDSILLLLAIRILDTLGNFGSLEYEDWSNHRQSWRSESAAVTEPPCNFIVSSHAKGKRRPRWAIVDKAYMHNTWRSSQSSYHLYRMCGDRLPSKHVIALSEDLLNLSLHNYETVRLRAGRSLVKMLKRWPTLIAKSVQALAQKLRDPGTPEHIVLGSCAMLSTQTILRHLTRDEESFSSFLLALLASSHHESLKAQKSITEVFIKFNIYFAGVPKSFLRTSDGHSDGINFTNLVSHISSISFDNNNLHWRYNLMANRTLLLLTMACRSESHCYSKIVGETTGHFLKNLNGQLPQSRMLSISALNTLLREAPHKIVRHDRQCSGSTDHTLEAVLSQTFQEDGFFNDTLNSLSHVHITADAEGTSSKGHRGFSSFQSLTDESMTLFYFDFLASWPRTPNWISSIRGDSFYSSFARVFKRLAQECGTPVLVALQGTLGEFSNGKERPKQCIAAEVLAGLLHSDINGLLEAWESWLMVLLQNIILASSVESMPEWAACIRYAVTGKGKCGTGIPLLRHKILECLMAPISQTVATNVVAKRYAFLSAALIEISSPSMPVAEFEYHTKLLEELMSNLSHSSAQVREAIGVALCVLCSNMRLYASFSRMHSLDQGFNKMSDSLEREPWAVLLTDQVSELAIQIQRASQTENNESMGDFTFINGFTNSESTANVRRMETLFHVLISSLKSGRSALMLDIVVDLLYPVISLQETSNKDLSTLAKAAFELLKWRILPQPYLGNAVSVLLSSSNDPNWRTRFTTLTYLRTFMYRHTFILSIAEKAQIWKNVEKLLRDNQVEVREHAAGVLASLMKSGDEDLAKDFRDRAITEAQSMLKKRKQMLKSGQSMVLMHGAVLALAASVLSVPYDMPSWLPEHVTLLARFISKPSPVKSAVMKTIAEFRRTHADTWIIQKDSFTEEQLEVLADTTSSSSYFA